MVILRRRSFTGCLHDRELRIRRDSGIGYRELGRPGLESLVFFDRDIDSARRNAGHFSPAIPAFNDRVHADSRTFHRIGERVRYRHYFPFGLSRKFGFVQFKRGGVNHRLLASVHKEQRRHSENGTKHLISHNR